MLLFVFSRLDFDTLLVLVDVALPNIQVEGKYEVDGKILLLPIRGSGPLHGNFSNCLGICYYINSVHYIALILDNYQHLECYLAKIRNTKIF